MRDPFSRLWTGKNAWLLAPRNTGDLSRLPCLDQRDLDLDGISHDCSWSHRDLVCAFPRSYRTYSVHPLVHVDGFGSTSLWKRVDVSRPTLGFPLVWVGGFTHFFFDRSKNQNRFCFLGLLVWNVGFLGRAFVDGQQKRTE